MAKSTEHGQVVTTSSGAKGVQKIVGTIVKDGRLVADDSAPETGVVR